MTAGEELGYIQFLYAAPGLTYYREIALNIFNSVLTRVFLYE